MADAPPPCSADGAPPAADAPEEGASSFSSAVAPPTHLAAAGKTCALCGADFSGGRRLMRCGGCRTTHYCEGLQRDNFLSSRAALWR